MKIKSNLLIILLFISYILPAQKNDPKSGDDIQIRHFSGTLAFLSSNWMEGREAGTRGGFMAADYIASLMEYHGLQPGGDHTVAARPAVPENKGKTSPSRSYFQDFTIHRFKTVSASLSLITKAGTSELESSLKPETEFRTHDTRHSCRVRSEVVFAGYGLSLPQSGYDDYKNLDVKGKIVLVMNGYPGSRDTTSAAGKKIEKTDRAKLSDLQLKIKLAAHKGAIALIEINSSQHPALFNIAPENEPLLKSAMNSVKPADPEYIDDPFRLLSDTLLADIPVFSLSSLSSYEWMKKAGIDLGEAEKQAADRMISMAQPLKNLIVGLSVEVTQKPVLVRNVIGMIQGEDTTKCVVIGAHYDHLGIRNGIVYNGADDNASGVAGMLALARYWSGIPVKPPVNLVFAAWTAEEKGILGSSWFVENRITHKNQVLLNVNFDMISRSAPEDTVKNILSVGTLKTSEDLRKIAGWANQKLEKPFKLDLWEASESGGSDYVPFAAMKIPIMTFFSGFHDDYHSPRDTFEKTDLQKMRSVLLLSNECVKEVMNQKK